MPATTASRRRRSSASSLAASRSSPVLRRSESAMASKLAASAPISSPPVTPVRTSRLPPWISVAAAAMRRNPAPMRSPPTAARAIAAVAAPWQRGTDSGRGLRGFVHLRARHREDDRHHRRLVRRQHGAGDHEVRVGDPHRSPLPFIAASARSLASASASASLRTPLLSSTRSGVASWSPDRACSSSRAAWRFSKKPAPTFEGHDERAQTTVVDRGGRQRRRAGCVEHGDRRGPHRSGVGLRSPHGSRGAPSRSSARAWPAPPPSRCRGR